MLEEQASDQHNVRIICDMNDRPLVLAVDDEPDLCILMARILHRRGYEVRTAGGVTEAVDGLAGMRARPDLRVTDVNRPDGTGSYVAGEVRSRCGDVGVLYVSGYSRERAVADGLIDAGSTLLKKPFNAGQLV